MKKILISALCFMFCLGCANPRKIMIDPKTGHQVDCSTSGWGYIGAPVAISQHKKLVAHYEALGYVDIKTYEEKEGPKFTKSVNPPTLSIDQPELLPNDKWEFLIGNKKNVVTMLRNDNFNGSPVYVLEDSEGTHLLLNKFLGAKAILKDSVIENEFIPDLQPYNWPLSIGKEWEAEGIMKTPTGEVSLFTKYKVEGYGKVDVPAGTFDAYYIVARNKNGISKVTEIWYSPKVKYYVKAISYYQTGKVTEELLSYEISQMQSSIVNTEYNIEQKMNKLKKLLDKKLITQDDYDKKKQRLLDEL